MRCAATTISGTSPGQTRERISRTMSDTVKPMNAVSNGLEQKKSVFKMLKPWAIAVLPIWKRNGSPVDVEHSSDSEFQQWIEWNKIPVDHKGIAEWSFDDKCG